MTDVNALEDAQKDGTHWVLEFAPADKGGYNEDSFRIKHVATGKYFAIDAEDKFVLSAYDATNQKQVWQVGDNWSYVWNLYNLGKGAFVKLDTDTKALSFHDDGGPQFGIAHGGQL